MRHNGIRHIIQQCNLGLFVEAAIEQQVLNTDRRGDKDPSRENGNRNNGDPVRLASTRWGNRCRCRAC
jgi:hypothetical protein